MKIRAFLFIFILAGISLCSSCHYENDDEQTIYVPVEDPEPEPEIEWSEMYKMALKNTNCYIVKPGETVSIPIMKAYAVWTIYADKLGDTGFSQSIPLPEVLWQDAQGLITKINLAKDVDYKNSSIQVAIANNVRGNAVIAIKFDDTVRWSWHIWVTDYDPKNQINGKTYNWDNNNDGIVDYIWMDRNLGAQTNGSALTYTDSLAACGLLYEWGRKDPFVGDKILKNTNKAEDGDFDTKPIFDISDNLLPESGLAESGKGVRSEYINKDYTVSNMAKSIINPMVFYIGHFDSSNSSWGDWYKPEDGDFDHQLWGESGEKSPFDPCPEGWRVPAYKNELNPWAGMDNATTPHSLLGVFPKGGFRYIHTNGAIKNSGF